MNPTKTEAERKCSGQTSDISEVTEAILHKKIVSSTHQHKRDSNSQTLVVICHNIAKK